MFKNLAEHLSRIMDKFLPEVKKNGRYISKILINIRFSFTGLFFKDLSRESPRLLNSILVEFKTRFVQDSMEHYFKFLANISSCNLAKIFTES